VRSRKPASLNLKLVAGKAEQMASVVEELMDGAAVDQRGRTLLRTDEVDRQQHQQTAKERPGQKFAEGDDGKRDWLGNRSAYGVGHDETSWDRASQIRDELTTKEGLAYDGRESRLQWRDRSGVSPASSFHLQLLC